VEIPFAQSWEHGKVNNDIFSIVWHQLRLLFPPLGVCSHVGWLHSWDNLRTTKFARRCTRSEGPIWYEIQKQQPVLQTVFTGSTKSRLDACRAWGAWWCSTMKAGPFCVRWPTNLTRWTMNQTIAGTRVYISLLPAYTSIIFSSHITHTGSILNYLDITWHAQSNSSHSKIHPITYTALYVHFGLVFTTFNYIIMLPPPM
jgi:hypothetical protein